MFKLLQGSYYPMGLLRGNVKAREGTILRSEFRPIFYDLFIDGLATMVMGIDANRLGAWFPGPLTNTMPDFRASFSQRG